MSAAARRVLVLAPIVLLLAASAAIAQTHVDVTLPLAAGDVHVRGYVTPKDAAGPFTLEVQTAQGSVLQRKTVTKDADGKFDVEVSTLLPAQRVVISPGMAAPASVDPLTAVMLRHPIRDGARVVDGYVEPGSHGDVEVLVTSTIELSTLVARGRATPNSDGVVHVTLDTPLLAGQFVRARVALGSAHGDLTAPIVEIGRAHV